MTAKSKDTKGKVDTVEYQFPVEKKTETVEYEVPVETEVLSPLYVKPLRLPTRIALSLVVFLNSVLFIWCCVTSVTIFHTNNSYYTGWFQAPRYGGIRFILFLFWAGIPLIVWANSSWELFKRWRRTLVAKRIVITASSSIILWCVAVGYWSPCIFSSYWGGVLPFDSQPSYCPFLRGPKWVGKTVDVGGSTSVSAVPPPPRAYYLLPWFVILAVLLYVSYLTLGGIAYHRERKARVHPRSNCEMCGARVAHNRRYKITSLIYTDAESETNTCPSTLHSGVKSPDPCARPPSYGNLSSRRTSVGSMEKAHV